MRTVILLSASAIVAVSILFFLLFGGNNDQNQLSVSEFSKNAQAEQVNDISHNEVEEFSGKGTLLGLKESGRNLECQVVYQSPDLVDPVKGSYFVYNGRVRGDFQMIVPELGGSLVSSVILSNEAFYSWSRISGEVYGVMVDRSDMAKMSAETLNEPVPEDAQVTYTCKKWESVDESIFEPPSDVLFGDIEEKIEAGMEYGTIYEEGEF